MSDRTPGPLNADVTTDGSGQPENDRIAAAIDGEESAVELAMMEGLSSPFVDMVATVRFEAEWAEKHGREAIALLGQGQQTYETPEGLRCVMDRAILIFSTAMEAIKACRKAVE